MTNADVKITVNGVIYTVNHGAYQDIMGALAPFAASCVEAASKAAYDAGDARGLKAEDVILDIFSIKVWELIEAAKKEGRDEYINELRTGAAALDLDKPIEETIDPQLPGTPTENTEPVKHLDTSPEPPSDPVAGPPGDEGGDGEDTTEKSDEG